MRNRAPADKMSEDCVRKRRYRTLDRAQAIARLCEKDRGDKLRVYGCPLCGGFHLTRRLDQKAQPGGEA